MYCTYNVDEARENNEDVNTCFPVIARYLEIPRVGGVNYRVTELVQYAMFLL